MRRISKAAGVGASWLRQLFSYEKEPGITNVLKVCAALNVSPVFILTGVALDRAGEVFLRSWPKLSVEQQEGLVLLARGTESDEETTK
jgi:hypothetical protein